MTHSSRDPGLKGVEDDRTHPSPSTSNCLVARGKVPIDAHTTKLNNPTLTPRPGAEMALGMLQRPLYVVRYEVLPLPGADNFARSSGGFVNVWTEAASEQQALAIAAREVQEAGWQIYYLGAVHPTVRDDYAEDDSGLEYFEQALIDGIVLVFHTWREDTQH